MILTNFKVLTFDCYGTLIDWERGIMTALQPLLFRSGKAVQRDEILRTFARYETAQQTRTPLMIYSDLLALVHSAIAREWGVEPRPEESTAFGLSVPDWPAFADSAAALQYLQKHYKLAIFSNVDRASFKASNQRLGVEFDYIFTAQDIGSYKPDRRNFEYMIEKLRDAGYPQSEILHTAESLFHDHFPANKIGLASARIYRRHAQEGFGATYPPESMPTYDFQFKSMEEMVKAHQEAALRLHP